MLTKTPLCDVETTKLRKKRKKLTGRGGPDRGQGRHQKLLAPCRLSVNVEMELLKQVDVYCDENQLVKKTGGTRTLPRGDLVTTALRLYLLDPVKLVARYLFDNPEWKLETDDDELTWMVMGPDPAGTAQPIFVGAADEGRDLTIIELVDIWREET